MIGGIENVHFENVQLLNYSKIILLELNLDHYFMVY